MLEWIEPTIDDVGKRWCYDTVCDVIMLTDSPKYSHNPWRTQQLAKTNGQICPTKEDFDKVYKMKG